MFSFLGLAPVLLQFLLHAKHEGGSEEYKKEREIFHFESCFGTKQFLWEKWRLLSKKNPQNLLDFLQPSFFRPISLCYDVAISGPVAVGKKVESKGYNGRSPFPRRRRRERKRKRKGTAEDFLIGIWRRKRRKGKKMRNPPGEHEKKRGDSSLRSFPDICEKKSLWKFREASLWKGQICFLPQEKPDEAKGCRAKKLGETWVSGIWPEGKGGRGRGEGIRNLLLAKFLSPFLFEAKKRLTRLWLSIPNPTPFLNRRDITFTISFCGRMWVGLNWPVVDWANFSPELLPSPPNGEKVPSQRTRVRRFYAKNICVGAQHLFSEKSL